MTDEADRTREQLDKLAELEKRAQELVDRPHYCMHAVRQRAYCPELALAD